MRFRLTSTSCMESMPSRARVSVLVTLATERPITDNMLPRRSYRPITKIRVHVLKEILYFCVKQVFCLSFILLC